MKKLIHKLLFGSALLITSAAFAQTGEAKFIPDANSTPVTFAQTKGVTATYVMGTINGLPAFGLTFKNNGTTTVGAIWKIIFRGKGLLAPDRAMKISPNQTIDYNNNSQPKIKMAFMIKSSTSISDYKMQLKVTGPGSDNPTSDDTQQ